MVKSSPAREELLYFQEKKHPVNIALLIFLHLSYPRIVVMEIITKAPPVSKKTARVDFLLLKVF